ncbi:pur operon repressor [Niameybacter massiliensis]|uniref:Pur operon repressor n=1 Tax=Holtiella tumoricola TaxID=3018743 RepID=A0AA42DPJ8_9FIRM|nr:MULTISPECIES: pur operon repressor [Lachnospirales]MDA3732760.1 pur operon repressor [Holtiella tumoricola]
MKKVQKNGRIGIISSILTDNPNQIFTLTHFCDVFDCAKSTISEDIDTIRELFQNYGLGNIETVSGAAGGVYYNPLMNDEQIKDFTKELCSIIDQPDRMIPSGYIYTNDLLYSPQLSKKIGAALASMFNGQEIDYVVTVETKGIPIALMTARALNKPMVVVRNQSKLTDGTVIYMNYITGSNNRIKTMCLPTRAIKKGSKVLFIDDFMKAGGTAKGILDLMQEFQAELVGVGVLMATKEPERKLIDDFKTLVWLDTVDTINKKINIYSAFE